MIVKRTDNKKTTWTLEAEDTPQICDMTAALIASGHYTDTEGRLKTVNGDVVVVRMAIGLVAHIAELCAVNTQIQ